MTLKPHLTHLETNGLIQLAQEYPELEYLFRHALVQDAAYESLLFSDRKQLHLSVGQTLEQLYPERLAGIAGILGQHFAAAEQDKKALHYFTLAGDTAVSSHANQEAITHFQQALALAHRLQADSDILRHLYLTCGRAHELLSQFEAAMAMYEEMERLAHERADRPFQLAALIAKTTLHIVFTPLHDPVRAEKMVQEALSLAAELHDKAAEISIERGLINLYRYSGRMPQAIASAERTVALLRPLNMPEQLAFVLYESAHCYVFDGRFPAAITAIQEAITLWRTIDNQPMLADGVATAALIHTYGGHYAAATAWADEALTISQTINNVWGQSFAQQAVGLVPWQQGQPDKAIATMVQSIELSKLAGLAMPQVLTRSDLALVYGSLGAVAEGLALAHRAVTVAIEQLPDLRAVQSYALVNLAQLQIEACDFTAAEDTLQQAKQVRLGDGRFFTLLVDMAYCHLALAQGHYQQGISQTDMALAQAQQFGTQAYTPQLLLWQAQALRASGQLILARERLQEARAIAETLGSKRILWQILAALSKLEQGEGKTAVYHQQAQTIIHFIAKHTPPDLRDTFLNLPKVHSILTGNNP